MKLKIVKEKGKLERYKYINLTTRELEIVPQSLVQCAYADSKDKFEFIRWNPDGTAECYDKGGRRRTLYGDAVRVHPKTIKRNRRVTKSKN